MVTRATSAPLWSRQPQGPVRLAHTPLTYGLVDALLPQGGQIIPVSRGGRGQPFVNTGTPGWAYHPRWGNTQDYGNSGGTKYALRSGDVPTPFGVSASSLKECSILVVARPATMGGTQFWSGYGLSSSGNDVLALGTDASGAKLSFFVRDHANVSQLTSGTAAISAPNDFISIGTRSEAANYHRLYLNGAEDLNTTCTSIGTVSFNRTAVGGLFRTSFGTTIGGQIPLVLIWNRALTRTEAAELSANPWQVFEARAPSRTGVSSGSVDFPRTLSAGARAFTGSSLTVTVQKNIALSAGARAVAGSNLTEAVGKNITLSAGARTFAGSNLTETVTKVIGLTAGARPFAGSDLNEQAPINIALSPGARAFAGSSLTFNIIGSGGGKDGHGLKSNNRLPYGWWSDPEYNPKLRSKKPLTEAEKEVIREAVDETQETGEPASLAANLLAGLVQPYEQNDRIDWSSINRSADEIKALRQGIAQYRKELQAQQEEDDDEEALLMIAH